MEGVVAVSAETCFPSFLFDTDAINRSSSLNKEIDDKISQGKEAY